MNKEEREKFQQLQNEINHERRCADALADALIHGGMTTQFEALLMHETLRNGIQYSTFLSFILHLHSASPSSGTSCPLQNLVASATALPRPV